MQLKIRPELAIKVAREHQVAGLQVIELRRLSQIREIVRPPPSARSACSPLWPMGSPDHSASAPDTRGSTRSGKPSFWSPMIGDNTVRPIYFSVQVGHGVPSMCLVERLPLLRDRIAPACRNCRYDFANSAGGRSLLSFAESFELRFHAKRRLHIVRRGAGIGRIIIIGIELIEREYSLKGVIGTAPGYFVLQNQSTLSPVGIPDEKASMY